MPRLTVTVRDGSAVTLPLSEPDGTLAAKWHRVAAEFTEAGHPETAQRIMAALSA